MHDAQDDARTQEAPLLWRTGEHTGAWWEDAREIRARVEALPFLRLLAEGTLEPEAFVEYIGQDSFYLANYSRALAMLATRAPSAQAAEFWAGSAQTAVAAERVLHARLIEDPALAGLPRPESPSPTTRGYMYTLLAACAYEPYEVGAAAVLPCFWIYAQVGLDLSARVARSAGRRGTVEGGAGTGASTEAADGAESGFPTTDAADTPTVSGTADPAAGHPYRQWIAEYGDPAFVESTQRAIDLVEEAAAGTTEAVRHRMREVFLDASRYEEMFWDAAHRRETWRR